MNKRKGLIEQIKDEQSKKIKKKIVKHNKNDHTITIYGNSDFIEKFLKNLPEEYKK